MFSQQKLDHFNTSDTRIWSQQYQSNFTHFKTRQAAFPCSFPFVYPWVLPPTQSIEFTTMS